MIRLRLPCIGKNIQLSKVCAALEEFFTQQQYQIAHKPIKSGCQILARPVSHKDKRPPIIAIVEGHPNEFTIEFIPNPSQKSSTGIKMSAPLIGTFAGLELKREYDQQEPIIKMENQFWEHIIRTIAKLKKPE